MRIERRQVQLKKERTLTKQEERRKQQFEAKANELAAEGYQRQDLSLNMVKVNLIGPLLTAPIVILFAVLHFQINGGRTSINLALGNAIAMMVALLLLAVVHEAIHGCTWALFAENHWKSISFGVMWDMLTPYCTCKDPLEKRQYIIGTLMPGILIGVIPSALAVAMNNSYLWILGIFMILGACGDLMVVMKLLKNAPKEGHAIYIDHPYECGLVMFTKK